jgi:photosystem II stability/assembly factor-like uncharacterized protein
MTRPQVAVFLLALIAIMHSPRRSAVYGRADEAAERSFFERRGVAPPDARLLAFEQMRRETPASAPSYTWESIGPQPARQGTVTVTGRVTAILLSPVDPALLVVGTSGGGIWRSTDRGASFVPVSDDQVDIAVGAMAIAPSNPDVMYAGMGDDRLGTGVLKSIDAGATWRRITTSATFPARGATKRIAVDPTDENVVWLMQKGQVDSGVPTRHFVLLKSVDGGVTWQLPFPGIPADFVIASQDGATVIVGASRLDKVSTGGIYRSSDRGITWQLVYPQGDPDTPPNYVLGAASGTIYAAAIDALDGADRLDLLASTDDGQHWTRRAALPDDSQFLILGANPHDGTLFFGGVIAHRSSDGGKSWQNISTHGDQRAFAFDPVDPLHVWIGNDGGLWESVDGGANVTSLAQRLSVIQLYTVNAHPTNAATLIAGAQDNGGQRFSSGREWGVVCCGDGGPAVFDPATSRILEVSFPATVFRFGDDGSQLSPVASAVTFGGGIRWSFIPPMVRGLDGTVWFATYRLFASKDFGTTWTPPAGVTDLTFGISSGNSRGDVVAAVAVSDSDPHVLYTGSAAGRVMLTHDAGVTWKDVTPSVAAAIGSVAISRTTPATAYVGFVSYGGPRVLETTDFGVTWSDAGSGLPNMPVNTIYVDPLHAGVVYAGTDIGVFRMDASSGNWIPYNNGMPPVVVTSFTTTADSRLIVGTYGRGAYELQETPEPGGARHRSVRH